MMHNDRRRRLLRVELKFLGQLDADTLRLEQFEKLRLIFEIRARRIAKTVTRALISLMEQLRELRSIAARDAEFFANALVPHLGQCLGRFDRQSVEQKIVGVIVRLEQLRPNARSPCRPIVTRSKATTSTCARIDGRKIIGKTKILCRPAARPAAAET